MPRSRIASSSTRDFCLAALQFTADHRTRSALLDDARRDDRSAQDPATGDLGRDPLEAAGLPRQDDRPRLRRAPENGRNVATTEPKDYACDIEQDFVPTVEVRRPFAYLIPPQYPKAIEVVRAHGIRVETLNKPTELEVEAEEIGKFTRARRVSEGHQTIDVAESIDQTAPTNHPRRTIVVRTAQPLGTLAVYLLEPRSDDGLATWNFFDDAIAPGQGVPRPPARETGRTRDDALGMRKRSRQDAKVAGQLREEIELSSRTLPISALRLHEVDLRSPHRVDCNRQCWREV